MRRPYIVSLDSNGPLKRGIRILSVIVVTAYTNGVQVAGQFGLPRLNKADVVDRGTLPVSGVGIRVHLMWTCVVVHERNTRTRCHRHFLRRHSACSDRDRSCRIPGAATTTAAT